MWCTLVQTIITLVPSSGHFDFRRESSPGSRPAPTPHKILKTTHSMYPPRNFPPRRQNRRENVNESIRAREVRAVFPDGTAEIMQTSAALRKAQEMGLDLVLV